jgi:uncharacterized protein YuzE
MRFDVPMTVTFDVEVGAAYVYLTNIQPGTAVRQVVVEGGDVVLDFDQDGHLLGIELMTTRLIPQALLQKLSPSSAGDAGDPGGESNNR